MIYDFFYNENTFLIHFSVFRILPEHAEWAKLSALFTASPFVNVDNTIAAGSWTASQHQPQEDNLV